MDVGTGPVAWVGLLGVVLCVGNDGSVFEDMVAERIENLREL